MISTEGEACDAGRTAGAESARRQLALQNILPTFHAVFAMVDEMPADRALWPAWLDGYGMGIREVASESLPVT